MVSPTHPRPRRDPVALASTRSQPLAIPSRSLHAWPSFGYKSPSPGCPSASPCPATTWWPSTAHPSQEREGIEEEEGTSEEQGRGGSEPPACCGSRRSRSRRHDRLQQHCTASGATRPRTATASPPYLPRHYGGDEVMVCRWWFIDPRIETWL